MTITKITTLLPLIAAVTGCVSYHDVDEGKSFFDRAGESRWNRSLPTSSVGSQLTGTYNTSPLELLNVAAEIIAERGDEIMFRSDDSAMMSVRTAPTKEAKSVDWYNVLVVGDALKSTVLISPHSESRREFRFAKPLNYHAIVVADADSIDDQRAVMQAIDTRLAKLPGVSHE